MFDKLNTIFFALLLIFLCLNKAQAQIDYCKLSQNKYNIHIFGESYFEESDRSNFLLGMEKIIDSFAVGDEINWVSHEKSKYFVNKICVPGCPDKSMLEKFLDDTCSVQVAKRDKVSFKNMYLSLIKNAFNRSGNKYSIINDFKNLQDYYVNRDTSSTKVFVFHSTLPYNTVTSDKKSFDKAFVMMVENHDLSKINLKNIKFVNVNQSENNRDFWDDLLLKGNEEGLTANFEAIILD
ncbi:hypothetical protein N9P07_05045 [Alphaproteobacteria bacterium]|nr:hypothetical protein [Alphaproteobacteria bacterium]